MNIWVISDLHLDYKQNRQWLAELSTTDFVKDVLILAGDLSNHFDLVEQAFIHLSKCFKQVFVVPGNHDLWASRKLEENSQQRLSRFIELASQHGLHSGIGTVSIQGQVLGICPLLSWYDYSFAPINTFLQERWMDYFAFDWPIQSLELDKNFTDMVDTAKDDQLEQVMFDYAVNQYFLDENIQKVQQLKALNVDRVMSFSHFLPRIDVMPDYIPEKFQQIYPVLGSLKLDDQLRDTNSTLHIYGHSHVNRDVTIDGVRYVNNAFGNPSEVRICRKGVYCVLGDREGELSHPQKV